MKKYIMFCLILIYCMLSCTPITYYDSDYSQEFAISNGVYDSSYYPITVYVKIKNSADTEYKNIHTFTSTTSISYTNIYLSKEYEYTLKFEAKNSKVAVLNTTSSYYSSSDYSIRVYTSDFD